MIALSFFFLVAIISVSSYNKRETKDLRALEWLSVSESNIKDDSFTNFEEYYIKSLNNFETRNVRAVSNDGGSASSGSGISDDDLNDCAYSIEATAFSLVSTSLHTLVTQCTSSLQSDDQYNFTVTLTNSNFTTHSQDSDLLYADKFELGKKYKVHVIANCSLDLCDDPLVMLSLNVSVTNYTNRLLPYGKILKDNKMSNVDDEAVTVLVNGSKPIPIFSGKYRKIYITSNGILSLTRPYLNWQAIPFPYGQAQLPIIAPYWTDLDLRTSENMSALFYKVYTSSDGLRAQNILKIASDRVQEFSEGTFDGKWVLVSTWSNAVPYLGISHENETRTFQLVLVSNYTATYTLYLYKQNSFTLQTYHHPTVVGYSAGNLTTYFTEELTNAQILNIDKVLGNTGANGQWMFDLSPTLSEKEKIAEKCLQWVSEQEDHGDWTKNLPDCPCSKLQANRDWRFSFVRSSDDSCAFFVATTSQHGLECCYDNNGALLIGPKEGGRYHYYHSLFYPSQHEESDSQPFSQCCEETENCELFYKHRPSPNCSVYEPPTPGFTWGDPHFETLDGHNYTFNGLGEFSLLQSTTHNLTVQIRLSKLDETSATVIKAVAIKSHDSQLVQIEINQLNLYVLYIGNSEYKQIPTDGEYLVVTEDNIYNDNQLSSVDSTSINNVILLNKNDTMIITTSSGAALTIGKEMDFLYLGVELSTRFFNSTEGLLGYFDEDPSNDFQLPNGTVLSNTLTEEELYSTFGLQWHVSESASIFHYHSQLYYSYYNQETYTFTPSFGLSDLESNPTLKSNATAVCEGDYSCLYDIAQTGDLSLGLATHEIRQRNQKIKQELSNFPPKITGSRQVVVATNETLIAVQYSAEDPDDGSKASLRLLDPVPAGIELNSTGHLLINISSIPSFPLYIISNDTNNTATVQRISLLLCDCKNNGTCIQDLDTFPFDDNGYYRLLCDCPAGFAGNYCQVNLHGCGNDPCPSYTTCETDSSANMGYMCGGCTTNGYNTNSDMKCIDVNECTTGAHNCTETCTNTDGGFKCSCNKGYRLANDDVTCSDIDECFEESDNCEQVCTNNIGSYQCSCIDGWTKSQSNTCLPIETCNSNNGLGTCSFIPNAIACSFNGAFFCYCENGYYIHQTCIECDSTSYGFNCNRECNCQNGGTCDHVIGCTCTAGWTGHDCTTEINTYTPTFSAGTPNTLSLPKALPGGTPLLRVSADDADSGNAGQVTYHLAAAPYILPPNISDGVGVFSINEASGLISLTVPFESLSYTQFLLHVEARDGAQTPKKSSHLIVVELNNNSLPTPTITAPPSTIRINENKPSGSVVYTINCTELYSINPVFTELTLAIEEGNTNNTFELQGDQLITTRPIDYERFAAFNLNISCTNAFNRTDIVIETIVVINLNDNPFHFQSVTYTVQLYENITRGELVLTVEAFDADTPNATIGYYMADNSSYRDLFSVNETTGKVIVDGVLMTPFDREMRDNYTLLLMAILYNDDNSVAYTAETTVEIEILDVNDFTPLFSRSLYLSSNLSQSNSYPDTVLYVSAIDRDLYQNGRVNYSIQSNPYFYINYVTGEIYVATASIERGNYILQVNATDGGSPSLIGTTLIDIYVRPTPEEIRFLQKNYFFSFPENKGPGSKIGKVSAILYDIYNVSIDEGSAAESISYHITGGSDTFFVNSQSGELFLKSLVDYEAESVYLLDIIATLRDFPSVPIATTRVCLTLQDINDNDPVFKPSMYSKVIYEDTVVGWTVLTVSATDKDENGEQVITYALEEGFDGPFTINATSGDIVVSSSLQSPKDFHFQVVATDTGEPSLMSEAVVYISIARRSTVHPVLNSTLYLFSIPESYASNNVIGSIGAITEGNRSVTEADGLGFRLRQPGYESVVDIPFSINTNTGTVTVTSPYTFNYESQMEYIFYVELYNVTNTTMVFDSTPVVVKILDINDNTPVFSEEFYKISIPFSTSSGTSILTVSATDKDSGSNSEILYSLSSSTLGFHVDSVTGVITVANTTLISGDYHVTITAKDKGDPVKSSTINVDITVLPEPSQIIIFSKSNYTFEVVENSEILTLVGTVSISEVVNQTFSVGDVTFGFKEPQSCFSIDANSGIIRITCSNLDRETQSNYNFLVVASAPNGLKAEVSVQVTIGDENDEAPQFDRDVYVKVIYSNYNGSSILLQPVVTDRDEGSNAVTRFNISSSDPTVFNIFKVNSNTGDIVLAFNNGSLPLGDFSFYINAFDTQDSSIFNTALVLITVVEPAPKVLAFSQSSLVFSVPENSPGGTLAGTLQLQTPMPINPKDYIGNLHFEILSGEGADYFHIMDANATIILVNNLLDREVSESHVILVQASFQEFHVTASAYITIEVTDKNDNAPAFNQTLYVASINTTSQINTAVITIHADDDDIGINELITYSLTNTTPYFTIQPSTGLILTSISPIPEDHYKLIVVAEDGGVPSLTSTSVVSVTVETPLPESISFVSDSYTFSIQENSPAGTYVGTVSIAQDSSALDTLLFSFVTPSDQTLAGHLNDFHLDPISGNISTLASIDREQFSDGQVKVKAQLPSEPTLSATATVNLVINDMNDNKPLFTDSIYTASATEGSINTASTILKVQASDSDEGINADITYQITTLNADFNIDQTSGNIKAKNSNLNDGIYHITVIAQDGGSPSLNGTAEVLITIYAPIPSGIAFQYAAYQFSGSESLPVGTKLATVAFKTIDLTYVTSIQYSYNTSGFVMVTTPDTLLMPSLYNLIEFDHENITDYFVKVTAAVYLTGVAINSATATTLIKLRITDENDNIPVFENQPPNGVYSASIHENSPASLSIIDLSVSDADSGSNSYIEFTLEDTYGDRFKVVKNGNNGQVQTGTTQIDRETDPDFLLVVIATDSGSLPLSSTAHLLVTILDVNDNKPELISNNNFNYSFPEEQKKNTVLFTVLANDVDLNSVLNFSISGGNDLFQINSSNGQVSSTVQLDSDNGPSEYKLNVTVSDGKYNSEKTLYAHLINVPNDNRPQFVNFSCPHPCPHPSSHPCSCSCPLRIAPTIPAGTNITYITAIDADGDNLNYTINNETNQFVIDSKTGLLTKIGNTNLDPGTTIELLIQVTDDSRYTLVTTKTCTLEVMRNLKFLKEMYIFDLPENNQPGAIVGGPLSITGTTNLITFTLEGSTYRDYFDLIKQSDEIYLRVLTQLDYDGPNLHSFSFSIKAVVAEGYLSSMAHITVNIIDLNDNSPIFTDSHRKFTIQDSVPVRTKIGNVNVTDADSGSNSVITFSITDSTSFFYIDATTGALYTDNLLSDAPSEVTLRILAKDGGTPSRNTTTSYTIYVRKSGDSGLGIVIGVVILSILVPIMFVIVCVLAVLLSMKKRERVKRKNRDPYLDPANDNWKLAPNTKSKGRKTKTEEFEMKRKSSQGDTSAYETMYEDDLMDPQTMPWLNPSYHDKIHEETDNEGSELTLSDTHEIERRLSKAGSQKEVPIPISRKGRRASSDNESSDTQDIAHRQNKIGGQKEVPIPISRRGRRTSSESNSELDIDDHLKDYQESTLMKPGERPPEYDFLLKTDDSNKPRRPLLSKDMFGPPSNSNQPSSSRKPRSTT